MRVAILGANGQLGTDLVAALAAGGHEVAALTHDDVRVEDPDSVAAALSAARPEAVLNAAAYHHLPSCEEHPGRAFAVNAQGALNVARVASDLGAIPVYFSTDYVFDGAKKRPYSETDPPHPLNVYAASKVAGEHLTLAYSERGYVLRISGLYGRAPCRAKGENFVAKMVRLAGERPEVRVVDDEVLTPTPTAEISARIVPLITSGPPGTYHLTCEGACSWYEFAREIFDTLKLDTPLYRTSVAEFPTGIRRPLYSVLENRRLATQDVEAMPVWRDALRSFLAARYLTACAD